MKPVTTSTPKRAAARAVSFRRSAALVRRLGNRAQLVHVKDLATGAFPGRSEIVGAGGIDFPSIFAASKGPMKYYVIEHDPRNDATFDPKVAAKAGFDYLSCVSY